MPEDKQCAWGQYLTTGNVVDGCSPCTNAGCYYGSGQDCVHCFAWQGDCINSQARRVGGEGRG